MILVTQKILLVDDCQEDRETYRRYLLQDKQHTYSILEAETGEEALALCRQQFPDVIVMDYLLPDMDGLELLDELNTQFAQTNLPVIILTGQGNEQIAVQAMKGGAADYLVKKHTTPVSLRLAIQNVLEKTRLSRQLEESEQRFQATFNQTAVGIAHIGLDGKWLLVNQKFCEIVGYSLEELHRRTLKDITYPDDRNLDLEYVVRMLTGEIETYSLEKRYIRQDNTLVWINLTVSLVRSSSGEPEYFICVVQDITERQQLEEDLRHRERQFSTLVENSPDVIFRLDRNLRHIYISPQVVRESGIPTEQFFGKTGRELGLPADVCQLFEAACHEAFATGQMMRVEYSMAGKQYVSRLIPEPGEDGVVASLMGITEDITERKRLEIALQTSEEKLRLSLDLNSIGIWEWNIATGVVFWNASHYIVLGYEPGEIEPSYQSWRARVHPDDIRLAEQRIIQALENHADYEAEFRLILDDGSIRWLHSKGRGLYDQEGKPLRMVGVEYDITERKQAQEKIREQAALLDVTTDAIFVRNLENCISYWNAGAQRLYGWQAAEVVSRNCHKFLYQQISPQSEEAFRTVVEQGEWQGELHKITKSGQEIIVSSRWTLIRNQAGQPKSILCVDTDITEKKQLETQFYRAQRLESLGTLASGIAHDLNNILTPILTIAQLLQLKCLHLNEQHQQLLKILEGNSKRGAELVKQITAFARGAEGKRVSLQPKHLLKEIERIVKSTFPKSIEIHTNIAAANLWTVSADPTQIHQVLMNLCVNARDAMPHGGSLRIYADKFRVNENYARMNLEAKVGNYVAIAVSDTGCGMSPEVKERIFEPFFTTKEPGKGTGLGLSTVIGIIKNHDGFVNVQSEEGGGSQFQVFLPAMETTATQPDEESQIPRGNGELILVVDDEAFVRDVTKTSLEEFNYKVLIASDSIEALSLYAQHQDEISLVLMDIQMPSMDGLNLIRLLQRMNPAVKIIAISGRESNRQLLEDCGIDVQAFLPKPYTMKELLGTIQGVKK